MDAKSRPAPQQESGFVIEDRSSGQPVYYDTEVSHGGAYGWNPSNVTALRFCRKVDGERFVKKHMPHMVGIASVVPYVRAG